MNISVNQSIVIHQLRIEGITNSSVLQIGSAGMIKAQSSLYNSGGFTEVAPELSSQYGAGIIHLAPPSE